MWPTSIYTNTNDDFAMVKAEMWIDAKTNDIAGVYLFYKIFWQQVGTWK